MSSLSKLLPHGISLFNRWPVVFCTKIDSYKDNFTASEPILDLIELRNVT